MLIRSSISNTKKFFQKTLQTVKSFFFSEGYEKLPKTPPFSHSTTVVLDMNVGIHPGCVKDLDKFYTDFTDRWDSNKDKAKKSSRRRKIVSSHSPTKQEKDQVINSSGHGRSFMKFSNASPVKRNNHQIERSTEEYYQNHDRMTTRGRTRQEDYRCSKGTMREGRRSCLVEQKLKELEMFDISNVEHLLDIEEVLHYYSRLTCPAYLDIVDKFFMDIYAEFFAPSSTCTPPPRTTNLRLRRRLVRN